MAESIEMRSRGTQVADQIESEIRSGTWTSRLPGNRTLAQRYGVSVKTCAAALDMLEERGWLAPAEVGRRRSIRKQPFARSRAHDDAQKRLLVIHPSVGSWVASANSLLSKFSSTWYRFHGEVIGTQVDYHRIKRPGPVLDALIVRHTPDAILLCMCGAHWSSETYKRLPFYQMGGPRDEGIPISLGAFSLNVEVRTAVEFLKRLGHERILLPHQSMSEPMRKSIVQGLSEGSAGKPSHGRWEDYCPDFSEDVPEVWKSYWEKAFKQLEPTAVVVFQDTHLLSFYGHCHRNGLRIPQDVSVICLDDTKLFKWYEPVPTYMKYPDQAAVAHFKKWVKGGLKPIGVKIFPLEMIKGETVAPARSSRNAHARSAPS